MSVVQGAGLGHVPSRTGQELPPKSGAVPGRVVQGAGNVYRLTDFSRIHHRQGLGLFFASARAFRLVLIAR